MNTFFLVVEVLSYAFAVFLFFEKKDLGIIYIPILIFANNIIEPSFSASLHYGAISMLILGSIARNGFFYKNNLFALLLFLYFSLLFLRSSDLVLIRSQLFSVLWLFCSVPLISAVYKKYPGYVIFRELSNCAVLILTLFLVNVFFCTLYKYSPAGMYGITKGVLYGNIYGAGFNILALAVFAVALKLVNGGRTLYIVALLVVSLAVIMLSLRRSVMLLSVFGSVIALAGFFVQKQVGKLIVFGSVLFLFGYVIYTNTSFKDEFSERYELRNLGERDMAEEKRFIEYELIYKDMFVYEAYSPWIGFEPLNSGGNYGRRVFDDRTLHADIPGLLHSSGIIGLALYLLMVATAFRQSLSAAGSSLDKLIIFFCLIAFVTFTITGRFTEAASMLLLYLLLMLPLAGSEVEEEQAPVSNVLENMETA